MKISILTRKIKIPLESCSSKPETDFLHVAWENLFYRRMLISISIAVSVLAASLTWNMLKPPYVIAISSQGKAEVLMQTQRQPVEVKEFALQKIGRYYERRPLEENDDSVSFPGKKYFSPDEF